VYLGGEPEAEYAPRVGHLFEQVSFPVPTGRRPQARLQRVPEAFRLSVAEVCARYRNLSRRSYDILWQADQTHATCWTFGQPVLRFFQLPYFDW
jgi:hypothetical protein